MSIHSTFERPRSHQKALDDLITRAYMDTRMSAQQKAILICLAWHAKNRAGQAYPSQATVSKLTGVCVSLVARAMKSLEELGYIEKKARHRQDGGKTSCLITIHGMQYFPEDYAAADRNGTQQTKSLSAHERRTVRDTEGTHTTYRTRKEDYLKLDSDALTAASTTLEREENENSNSEGQGERTNPTLAECKHHATRLQPFLAYLAANRQSLRPTDHDTIKRIEHDPGFRAAVDAATNNMSFQEAEQSLSSFLANRPRMAALTQAESKTIIEGLAGLPVSVARLACERVEEIYKPSWRIPPRFANFRDTVQQEIRTMTVIKNAMACFDYVHGHSNLRTSCSYKP